MSFIQHGLPKSKEKRLSDLNRLTLARTVKAFKWGGLPDTIPPRNLELILQVAGTATIAPVQTGELYAFKAGLGGEQNPYYESTLSNVSNPALKLSKNYKIGTECEIIRNDPLCMGLMPILNRYNSLLIETDISIFMADVNARVQSLIVAGTEKAKTSAELYIKKLLDGDLAAIGDDSFLEGIKTAPYATGSATNSLTQLIELHGWLKGSLYQELGLRTNANLKREAVNAIEAEHGADAVLTLIESMLSERQEGCERVNRLFGTSWSVELSGSWERVAEEIAAEAEAVEAEEEREAENGSEEAD